MFTGLTQDAVAHVQSSLASIARRLHPAAFNWYGFVPSLDAALMGSGELPTTILIEAIDLSTSLRFHKDAFPSAYNTHLDELVSAYASERVLILQLGFNNKVQVLRGPVPLGEARRFTTAEFDHGASNAQTILLPGTRITSAVELVCAIACYLRSIGFAGLIRTALMTDGWNSPRPRDPAWEQESAYQAWLGLEGVKLLAAPFDLFGFVDQHCAPMLRDLCQQLHLPPEQIHIMSADGQNAWQQIQALMGRMTGRMTNMGEPTPPNAAA